MKLGDIDQAVTYVEGIRENIEAVLLNLKEVLNVAVQDKEAEESLLLQLAESLCYSRHLNEGIEELSFGDHEGDLK